VTPELNVPTPPLEALTLKLDVPTAVPEPVVTVMVVDPAPASVEGLKLAVAPLGRPVAEKLTVPLKPSKGETVMVYLALPPGVTGDEPGLTSRLKSCTVSDAVAL
jgi:hypothetical protein